MNEIPDRNEDPITGEPGAHPVGTGVGTTGGALAGAAVGSAAGPVGTVVGAVAGGVAGAFAGKALAEEINPTAEEEYWQANHPTQSWADDQFDYENDYRPAYKAGYQGYAERGGQFEEAESDLERDWDNLREKSKLNWHQAKDAVRAGWHKVERALPGDADGDGR